MYRRWFREKEVGKMELGASEERDTMSLNEIAAANSL